MGDTPPLEGASRWFCCRPLDAQPKQAPLAELKVSLEGEGAVDPDDPPPGPLHPPAGHVEVDEAHGLDRLVDPPTRRVDFPELADVEVVSRQIELQGVILCWTR